MLSRWFLIKIVALLSTAGGLMGYGVSADQLTVGQFVVATVAFVGLIVLVLKHEAERLLGIVDRIPKAEWFDDLDKKIDAFNQAVTNLQARVAHIEGRHQAEDQLRDAERRRG